MSRLDDIEDRLPPLDGGEDMNEIVILTPADLRYLLAIARAAENRMVYITREEDEMDKNEILKAVMRHAVEGHSVGSIGDGTATRGTGYHTFCNDPKHAEKVLADNGHILKKKFAPAMFTVDEEALDAENEGMPARG